jgi:hypothetical protein
MTIIRGAAQAKARNDAKDSAGVSTSWAQCSLGFVFCQIVHACGAPGYLGNQSGTRANQDHGPANRSNQTEGDSATSHEACEISALALG